jgi:integrase/recombinase XerD
VRLAEPPNLANGFSAFKRCSKTTVCTTSFYLTQLLVCSPAASVSRGRNAVRPAAAGAIALYLEGAGHGADKAAPLFQPVSNNARGAGLAITPGGVYQMLAKYAAGVGIEVDGFGPHALRATAATNALEHNADIAKVQQWLGHANISTTRAYDRRDLRAEDSPTFKVAY